ECAHGILDELRAVVGDDHFDAFGQTLFDLLQPLLHPVDHAQSVFSVAHDDDAAGSLTLAVELRDAASNVGPQTDLSDIPNTDRSTVDDLDRTQPDVFGFLDVATPADHLLVPGNFDHSSADLLVRGAHGPRHVVQRDAVAEELVGI